jgi:hypothetical protein
MRQTTSAEPIRDLRVCREAVQRDWYGGEAPVHTTAAVADAATRVFRSVNSDLERLGGPGATIAKRLARELWNAQWQAHMALVAKAQTTKPHRDAKQQRLAAADGRALSVCVGYAYRRLPEETMRFFANDMFDEENYTGRIPLLPLGDGDGCGTIFDDSRTGKPGPPRRYCDRCSARAGRTPNAGLVKNAVARLRARDKRCNK